jgi:hypothetical protein
MKVLLLTNDVNHLFVTGNWCSAFMVRLHGGNE